VRRLLKSSIFHEAPLNHEVAIQSRTIELSHEDPADRFLCATASVFDLTLLTADTRILEGEGYSVIANE
jgi:PIN domain nuclease of toxin-antitoxin system